MNRLMGCTWKELLDHLGDGGHLSTDQVEGIRASLSGHERKAEDSLVLQIFTGIGGWLSAIFLLFFLGVSRIINFNEPYNLQVWGVMILGAAVFLSRREGGLFIKQLGLALGAAGYALALTGVGIAFDTFGAVVLASLLLTTGLYPVYRDGVFRFLAVATTLVMTVVWGVAVAKSPVLIHLLVLFQALTLVLVWRLGPLFQRLAPLVYALTITLFFSLTIGFYPDDLLALPQVTWWPSQLGLTLWLGFLILRVRQGFPVDRRVSLFGILAGLVLLGAVSSPGILASLGVLVLGQSRNDRWLSSLGLMGFAFFIFFFYYFMSLPLDQKSHMLMGSGVLLLLGRYLLGRFNRNGGRGA